MTLSENCTCICVCTIDRYRLCGFRSHWPYLRFCLCASLPSLTCHPDKMWGCGCWSWWWSWWKQQLEEEGKIQNGLTPASQNGNEEEVEENQKYKIEWPPPSLIYSRGSGSKDQVAPRVTLPLLIIKIKKTTVFVIKKKRKDNGIVTKTHTKELFERPLVFVCWRWLKGLGIIAVLVKIKGYMQMVSQQPILFWSCKTPLWHW